MSEVNVQKEKTSGIHTSPQKRCDENERNKQENKQHTCKNVLM